MMAANHPRTDRARVGVTGGAYARGSSAGWGRRQGGQGYRHPGDWSEVSGERKVGRAGDRVGVEVRDGIAVVRIDNPPVNALDAQVRGELATALERLATEEDVQGVVVTGAGRTFVAGADIKELEAAVRDPSVNPPDFHDLLRLVEDHPRPIVMAVNGPALGGGLELAMAGHYRVASGAARLGLPEVNLGIIPGAEGTQRLPRLVGVAKALDMCVSGRPIDAEAARRAGLVDAVIEGDCVEGAVAFARDRVRGGPPHARTREREDRLGPATDAARLVEEGRERARVSRPRQTAPLAVVDAIEAAATLPFEEGSRRERALSLACVRSEQARAMVHAFLAERAAARGPGLSRTAPLAEIASVAVVGAGTMGATIAMAFANAGLTVSLGDVSPKALERALGTIRGSYQRSRDRGRLAAAAVEERLARIRPGIGYDGCSSADLVIEAVFEDLALKKEVFGEIDRGAPPDCVLATNTSTLDVDALAAATSRPASVLGLHFFSPAHVMRLVEIVRGGATADETLAAGLSVAKRLGKVGVVVGNAPGFVGNRIMFGYMYEAQFLVEEGATPEQVDRVLTDWGMAMGIFAVDDLGGLDVAWRIRRELRQFDGPGARRPLVADRLVEMGRLGQKTGRGWHRYDGDRKPVPDPEVVALIEEVAGAAGISRRTVPDEEILERTIYALVNEGARALEEGVARSAADIDVVYLTGYGFPSFRGGPMFHADAVGLPRIHDRVAAFHRELGPRWEPAPLLSRLAQEGSTFREYDASRARDGAAEGA
jgi:3-hydroxyacyl-CoA dehydrogenase